MDTYKVLLFHGPTGQDKIIYIKADSQKAAEKGADCEAEKAGIGWTAPYFELYKKAEPIAVNQ